MEEPMCNYPPQKQIHQIDFNSIYWAKNAMESPIPSRRVTSCQYLLCLFDLKLNFEVYKVEKGYLNCLSMDMCTQK